MKLEVHERIAVLGLIPKEGDYASLKEYRRAREMFSFTPAEVEYYELRNSPGADGKPQVVWNKEKAAAQVKDVPVTEFMMDVIRGVLADMNKKRKLTEEFISLYEKFVVLYQ